VLLKESIVWSWDFQRGCYVGRCLEICMFKIYKKSILYEVFVGSNIHATVKVSTVEKAKKFCFQYLSNFVSDMQKLYA